MREHQKREQVRPSWRTDPDAGRAINPGLNQDRDQLRGPAPAPEYPGLSIGTPGDQFEQEAERVAGRIVSGDTGLAPTTSLANVRLRSPFSVQSSPGVGVDTGLSAAEGVVNNVLRSRGTPLSSELRGDLEPKFGHDFSRVRIHANVRAATAADALSASAFTSGPDVYFAAGRFEPHTRQGRQLLAHELTHVVQQDSGPSSSRPCNQRPFLRSAEAASLSGRDGRPDIHPSTFLLQRQRRQDESGEQRDTDNLERMAEIMSRNPELEDAKRLLEVDVARIEQEMNDSLRAPLPVEESQQKRMSSDERWALYQDYLDRSWTGRSERERLTALRAWGRYLTSEEFNRFKNQDPEFRRQYERYMTYYSGDSPDFNIDTGHIGQVGGVPISGRTAHEYRSQAATIGLAQRHSEAAAMPFQAAATGISSKVGAVLKLIAAYHSGVSAGEAVTGHRSGASLPDLLGGKTPDVAGEPLSRPEIIRRLVNVPLPFVREMFGEPVDTILDIASGLTTSEEWDQK